MKARSRKLIQQTIAMIVVAALLQRIGLPAILIIFFFMAGLLIWVVLTPSKRRDTQEIFEFYIAVDEILRDEERQWYNFEISEIVRLGEEALGAMPDPPPLVYFSLGALQHRAGDYESAVENLAAVVETELVAEHRRSDPSPALRQYVQLLRSIEREPAIAPMALAATHSLERRRRTRAAMLLAESRERLLDVTEDFAPAIAAERATAARAMPASVAAGVVPRPISEVLHDVYEDEETS